jgi:ribonuclease HI
MFSLMLFTDGSVNTKTRVGYGAFLAVSDISLPLETLKTKVKVKQFENTSSTRLELQTLLWAIDEVTPLNTEKMMEVRVYSDSQNIVGLSARRSGLERRNYHANNGKPLRNAELYKQFYRAMDQFYCQVIKVDGHNPQHTKNDVDRLFALVDKAARSALRKFTGPIKSRLTLA